MLDVDCIPGLVFTQTPEGRIEFINEPLRDYLGRTLEGLQDWHSNDSVHPDDIDRVTREWKQHVAAGIEYVVEHRLRRADGQYRWFQLRVSPARDAEGRLLRWYGLLTDIDAFKEVERAARSSESGLRLLIDSIPGLVYTMTPACELEAVNRQVLDYFGKTVEELKSWDQIGSVHPDDMPRVLQSLRRTVEFGEPHEVEQRLRRADGTYRWFKPGAQPLRDAQGKIVRWYCLLTDIDDLKRAEEVLRNLQARFARAAQLATLSELAASIAHEVNQPLAAVVASAHACHRWLSTDPPSIERAMLSAERIVRDGSSAAAVVTRIRSLFRHAPAEKQMLDINEVIEQVCELMVDDLRERAIVLRTDLKRDLPRTAADRVQLQQLIANLVRNAMEAMETVQERPRELSIASSRAAAEITVHVKDRGVGLVQPDAVFEPFYTTKQSGMGMGLAICRSIIDAHGGRLWSAPNAPHGTTFSFALPLDHINP
jgi:PAS domain S-box-containing protein